MHQEMKLDVWFSSLNSTEVCGGERQGLTCVLLYSTTCDRPKAVATAAPPTIAVRFRAFLNAIGPAGKVKCSEETEPGRLGYEAVT